MIILALKSSPASRREEQREGKPRDPTARRRSAAGASCVGTMPWRTLLGRARELADLEGALDQAIAGHGSVFLMSGEAGIGKSRLAEEIARFAERRGATVLWGRASEVAGAPPCWPWVQLLRASAEPPASGLDVIATALERRRRAGLGRRARG